MRKRAAKGESTRRQAMKGSTKGRSASGASRPEKNESKAKRATAARGKPGIAREKGKSETPKKAGLLKRAAASVTKALSRRKGREKELAAPVITAPPARTARQKEAPRAARPAKREADIPMDQIAQTYSPTQTSLKAPFRVSGADHQSDQEFASGVGDGTWNDEDRFTNKSGDPRIGTHGRTYEPNETLGASRREKNR